MPLSSGPKLTANNNLVFAYDIGDTKNSYIGEPTTNIVPSPTNNSRFTTNNTWGTYNTAQYNSNTYFNIGTVSTVSNNEVTLSTIGRTIYTYDVLTPQTTGGGVTAGTYYMVKKTGTNTFTLHTYNSSQNGSQGYRDITTGNFKVHESVALDQRISINATNFPTMWWGPPHQPNMCYVKEVRSYGGPNDNSSFMRIHLTRPAGTDGGMAYGVYPSVTLGDSITVSFWARSSVNANWSWSTYFGPSFSSPGFSISTTTEWQRFQYTWTASNTYNFYLYFWPGNPGYVPYYVDLADIQVEINKGHATQFTLNSRTSTQGLLPLIGNATLELNTSYKSNTEITFDGTDDFINVTLPSAINVYCLEMVWYNINAIPNTDGSIGGPSQYQTPISFNNSSNGVHLGGWTGGLTNEAIHIWNGGGATSNQLYVGSGYHHVIFNWNGTTYDIWVDGVKTTTYYLNGYLPATLINATSIKIGDDINSYNFYGDIPIVKIYNEPISSLEIQQNYQQYKKRFNLN